MSQDGMIGGRTKRVDAWDKVLGRTLYPGDLQVEKALHAAVLRSPHPHARIQGMNLESARALPDVVAVLNGDDIEGPNAFGLIEPDQPVLAKAGGKASLSIEILDKYCKMKGGNPTELSFDEEAETVTISLPNIEKSEIIVPKARLII